MMETSERSYMIKKLFGSSSKKKKKKARKHKLNVGDEVMLSKVRRTFKKGYLPGWTEKFPESIDY